MTTLLLLALLAADEGCRLDVDADGFKDSTGQALARLYLPGMNVTGPPSRTATSTIVGGRARLSFEALPCGSYAVVVVHDENGNGVIDHRLGLPAEPLGFSSGFRLGLFSGLPTFEKLRFELKAGAPALSVTVR